MKRSFNFVMQNIGGVKLLIPLGSQVADSNGVITLNNTAAYIWELLAQEHSVEELSTSVANFFGIDVEVARTDVQSFISEVAELGLFNL